MALVHEFEKSGNWLFKRRGWLPLFIFIPSLAYIVLSPNPSLEYSPGAEIAFLAVSLLGQVIRAVTVGRTPKNTSGRNIHGQLAEKLNTTGIYSVLRHPLYLGNFFMWLGPVLFLRSVWIVVIFCLAYWLYYERIMFAEEQFLRRKFSESYDRWSEKVKSFIPSFSNYTRSDLSFSFRNVLKREYNGFGLIFIVFALLDVSRNYSLDGEISIQPLWGVLLVFGLLSWLILRIIKKHTSWLNVEGR
ncbi:MAG: isoprenylcysteine carboxylmethyltransferase family protein [Bacteroidales bacterium]|nr:isoprenylcysteine carboxylmethyltransferase family protein [Bacteroidales bacterium]